MACCPDKESEVMKMEKTITLSYLADLIIVCGFAGIIGTVGGTAIGHLVLFIGGKIRDAWRKHHPKKEPETAE